jgi:hypothetical protein
MPNLPQLGLRFPRRQIVTFSSALGIIVGRYRQESISGSSIRRVLRPGPGPGLNDERLLDRVFTTHRRLLEMLARPRQTKFRLKLDVLDLALLLFAARIGRKYSRGDSQAAPSRHTVRVLERYRKRAQREAIASLGRPAYHALRLRWASFVRWVRFNLFPGRAQTRGTGTLLRHYRRIVERLAAEAQRGLDKQGVRLKSAMVRRLVRRALRYVRRGRAPVTLRDLETIPRLAEQHLFDFILSAKRKQNSTSSNRSNHDS